MSNAIDRKLVYAFLFGLISDDVERKKALEYINELPPVYHHENWTKYSPDNLPDIDVDVMGTTKDYGNVVKVTRMQTYCEDAGWEWVLTDDVEGNSYHPDEIIAWMPLPKPYKQQESEEENDRV